MTALADTVREKAELTGTLTIDEMTAAISDLVVNGVEVDARTLTVTPSKSQQTFNSSSLGENAYYSSVTVNAIPDEYITTDDATAESADILSGKTAYINGKKVTGNMTNHGDVVAKFNNNSENLNMGNGFFRTLVVTLTKKELTITPSAQTQTFDVRSDGEDDVFYSKVTVDPIPAEYVKTDDATVTAEKLLEGVTAYGANGKVTGTIPTASAALDGNVVTVSKGYISEAQTLTVGSAKGAEIYTPGTSAVTIPADTYLTGDQTIKGDGNLTSENIKTGVTIFDVEGTFTSDANATASDIASGKTAYVNGEKIVGTKKASGGVIPLWERYYARLFGSVTASSFVQNPVTKNGYYGEQFFVVDGKLIYRHVSTYSYPLIVDTSAEWTWAKWADPNAAHGLAIAIAGNSFYVVESVDTGSEGSSASTYRPPSMTVKRVASDLPGPITGAVPSCCWGNHVFSMNGGLFIADHNRYAHVAYKRELEDDPFVYVSVGKLPPEGVNGVPSYYFLTSSGDIACVEWESGRVNMDSGRVDWAENETLAEGNPFVNYRHIYSEYAENGTYELAVRSDGNMWFRAPGWKNTWSKVYINGEDVKFIATNELGYCEAYISTETREDPDTGEIVEYYTASYSAQALHIDTQGRAWRFKSAFSGSSFTGVTAVLVDDSTDWQCVPPFIEKNKVYYVQKGGKLYRAKIFSDDDMELNMVEDPVQPSGKLVCSNTLDANLSSLWFAPEDAVIDMSHSGGTYTM